MSTLEINVKRVLKSVFGYENFKNDVQKDAILAICKGMPDMCILMPPGFGRSLCFQLPILLQKDKIGLVLSPKLSYVMRELEFLKSKGIKAAMLNKRMHIKEKEGVLNDLISKNPTIVLLYVTCDVGTMSFFKKLVISLKERKRLSYIVFNEAHCLSESGYDYVPAYKNNRQTDIFKKIYTYIPRIAVTTTVSNKVIQNICDILMIKSSHIFQVPVQRLKVYLDIWFIDILSHPFDHLKSYIIGVLGILNLCLDKTRKNFAVIYCREVATAEELNNKFNASGISTIVYHHKLSNSMKRNVENKWLTGQVSAIITTFDYGFIYKQTIRCIVYWTVPEHIAKYYRNYAQTDTASCNAHCRIYYSVKEYSSVKLMIESHRILNDEEHIEKRLSEYDQVVSYCLSVTCRHKLISKYFECTSPSCRRNCDVCENKDMVALRTHKFITYSKDLEGLEYKISNMSEELEVQQFNKDAENQLIDTIMLGKKCKKTVEDDIVILKVINNSFTQPCDNAPKRRKISYHQSKSQPVVYNEDHLDTNDIQIIKEYVPKRSKKTPNTIGEEEIEITRSLLETQSLNASEQSDELLSRKRSNISTEGTINTDICNN